MVVPAASSERLLSRVNNMATRAVHDLMPVWGIWQGVNQVEEDLAQIIRFAMQMWTTNPLP